MSTTPGAGRQDMPTGESLNSPSYVPEPTLAAMRDAAELVRAANHAAYEAPRTTASVYARVGELYALLGRTRQLAQVLGEHAAQLARNPALRADDGGGDPQARALVAAGMLRDAGTRLDEAATVANQAWSRVAPLYLADQ